MCENTVIQENVRHKCCAQTCWSLFNGSHLPHWRSLEIRWALEAVASADSKFDNALIIVECDKFKFSSTLPPNVDLKNVLKKTWNIEFEHRGEMFGLWLQMFHISPKTWWGETFWLRLRGIFKKTKATTQRASKWSDSLLQGDLKTFFRSTFGAEVDENFDWLYSTITKWWKHGLIWSLLRPQLHGLNELWKTVSVSSVNR